MDKEECKASGGLGRFNLDICFYCGQMATCDLAKEGRDKYNLQTQKDFEKRYELVPRHHGSPTITKKDLVCIYCNRSAEKCKCKDKEEARFEVRKDANNKKKIQ